MSKYDLLERLAAGPIADLPGPECHELAALIAKLTESKAPATMAQKRLFIENWFTDNKGEMSTASKPPPRRAAEPPPQPPPSRGGGDDAPMVGRPGKLGYSPRGAPSPPAPRSPKPSDARPAEQIPEAQTGRGDLNSVEAILGAISQFKGGDIPTNEVHDIADAIQRFDNTRQPGALEQKRVYIDDFFRSKTGASIGGGGGGGMDDGYGQQHHSSQKAQALAQLQDIDSGEALLDAVHVRILHGQGWLSSLDEAIPLARAVHNFTNMPTDGSDPQMYVADWYNWVRHTSQPLPPPAIPPHEDESYNVGHAHHADGGSEVGAELRREIAELNYQVRSLKEAPPVAQQQPAAGDGAGKENALWAMISSLTSQVQNLTSQVANSNEKASQQQQQLMQQQLQAQQQLAQQQMVAMQMAFQRGGGGSGGGAELARSPGAATSAAATARADVAEEDAGADENRPAPGSSADVERQLLDYLARFYEHGKDVPLDNLGKVCEHICTLSGREVPRQLAKKRELAQAWYDVHKAAKPKGGGGGAAAAATTPQRPQTAPGGRPDGDPSHVQTPRNPQQLLALLDSFFQGNPELDLPLAMVPKFSSSIAELSSKNAPKLVKDKRDFIKEYYRKQLAIAGRA